MVILANALVEQGYSVDLLVAVKIGPYLKEISPIVNVIDLKQTRMVSTLFPLIRYLRMRRPTVTLSVMRHTNMILLLACKLTSTKTKCVVSERNDPKGRRLAGESMQSWLIKILCRKLYKEAYAVHAVSRGVADATAEDLQLAPGTVKVIYNPVVDSTLQGLAKASADKEPTSSDEIMIVGAGRLAEAKDFTNLICAFSLLRNKLNARLVIMGEGPLREDLENLVRSKHLEEHVTLPGFIENPFAVMRQADLFVLSSVWEGLPNVLIQAMACGTPVVSTDCPSGPAEILENGKWGRLVPIGDAEALAEAMETTLKEKEHPNVKKRAADFSVENAVEGYLDMFFPERKSG